jgi:hypothetical protein
VTKCQNGKNIHNIIKDKKEKSGKKDFLGWDVPSKNSNPDSPKSA